MTRARGAWRMLGGAIRALAAPAPYYAGLRDEPVPAARLLLIMAGWGVVFSLLHFLAMNGAWLWHGPPGISRCRLLTFVLGSPVIWLLGSAGLRAISRWWACPLTLAEADHAALPLWCAWALMPLVDLVHLAGVPKATWQLPIVHAFVSPHASWLIAFPLIVWHLAALFRWRTQASGWRGALGGMAFGAGVLAMARLGIEPLVQAVPRWLKAPVASVPAGDWWVVVLGAGVLGVALVAWRSWLQGRRHWLVMASGLAGEAAVILMALPLRYQ